MSENGTNQTGSTSDERSCAYPQCTTTLSIYNVDYLCWTHADLTTRARFERTSARISISD